MKPADAAPAKTWVVDLAPASEGSLGWSAKGVKVPLEAGSGGLSGAIELGPMVAGVAPVPIRVRLSESQPGKGLDRLALDSNRNGEVDAGEVLETEPSESRGKLWSSFNGTVNVPVTAPDGAIRVLPFPLALWYVADPAETDADPILRWSARGWMEGQFESPSGPVTVCLAESNLDAIYGTSDRWAIGSTPKEAHGPSAFRGLDDHNWCGDEAWKMVEFHPSGLQVTLQRFDPGVTYAEETEARDRLAPDKRARRAKKPLAFSHDFVASEAAAKKGSQQLFLDFETTWCGPCKQMDVLVYTAQDVVDAAKGVVCVKLDGDEQKDLVKRFQVAAYPTLILLGPDGQEVRRAVGYQSVLQMKAFFQ
ncbi:MAG: thiol-disulfide isomerase/thioredoxin [Planctomycetota bacterium]